MDEQWERELGMLSLLILRWRERRWLSRGDGRFEDEASQVGMRLTDELLCFPGSGEEVGGYPVRGEMSAL